MHADVKTFAQALSLLGAEAEIHLATAVLGVDVGELFNDDAGSKGHIRNGWRGRNSWLDIRWLHHRACRPRVRHRETPAGDGRTFNGVFRFDLRRLEDSQVQVYRRKQAEFR